MSDKIWTASMVAAAVLGIVLAIFSAVGGGCGGMLECSGSQVPMKCHWTFLVVAGLGVAAAVMGVAGILQKETKARRVAGIGILVLDVLALAVLFALIGVCANAEMSCNASRTIAAVIIVVMAVVAIIGMAKADAAEDAKPKAKL